MSVHVNDNQCPICGGAISITAKLREVHIGKRTVDVHYEAPECEQCGEAFYSPEDMDALQSRASQTIRTREGLLQPDAIRRLRDSMGLSQVDLEQLLGVGPKTVVRWERGTVFQNAATDSLLRVLAAIPAAVRYLATIRGVQVRAIPLVPQRMGRSAKPLRAHRYHYTEVDPQVMDIREHLQRMARVPEDSKDEELMDDRKRGIA